MEKHLSATGQEIKTGDLVELIDGDQVEIEEFMNVWGRDQIVYNGMNCRSERLTCPSNCVVLVEPKPAQP